MQSLKTVNLIFPMKLWRTGELYAKDTLSVITIRLLFLQVSKDYIVTTLNRWQASPYEDVEAAVSLFYSLGEALPASHGNHFSLPSTPVDISDQLANISKVFIVTNVSVSLVPLCSGGFCCLFNYC